MEAETKEALVVYEGRRRPIVLPPIEDANAQHICLLDAAKHVFSDLIDSYEGSSSQSSVEPKNFYLQIESSKWGGQLIELTGAVSDGAVVHLTQESASSKVICDPISHAQYLHAFWLVKLYQYLLLYR